MNKKWTRFRCMDLVVVFGLLISTLMSIPSRAWIWHNSMKIWVIFRIPLHLCDQIRSISEKVASPPNEKPTSICSLLKWNKIISLNQKWLNFELMQEIQREVDVNQIEMHLLKLSKSHLYHLKNQLKKTHEKINVSLK